MAKNHSFSFVRKFVYRLISFALAFILFLISLCVVLQISVFNKNTMLRILNECDYYNEKRTEILNALTDLGYASGLREEFFSAFVDPLLISNDTKEYINDFFAGKELKIDDSEFKKIMTKALDTYIEENNIQKVNPKNKEYLINRAGLLYRRSLENPVFSRISGYFNTVKKYLLPVTLGLGVAALIIVLALISTNRWKHRAVRYICGGTGGAALAVAAIPFYLSQNRNISAANIDSRALHNYITQTIDLMGILLWVISGFLLAVTIALIIVYRKLYNKLKIIDAF